MKNRICLLSVFLFLGVTTQAADKGKWIDLLEGNQFSKHWETTGNWNMSPDGVITLTPRPGEKGWSRWSAYLWSKEQYDDFEIDFEYKLEPKGNSGFYFNVADKDDPVGKGVEVQIYDSHGNPKLTDHTSGGVIPGIAPTKNSAKSAGEWNRFHITCQDQKLTVKLNGEVVNVIDLNEQPRLKGRPDQGYIGFQDHGLPISLRNIRIRRI